LLFVEHRRGVAGGGWEDEDEDAEHDTGVNVHAAEHSISSSSAAGIDTDRWRIPEPLCSLSPQSLSLFLYQYILNIVIIWYSVCDHYPPA